MSIKSDLFAILAYSTDKQLRLEAASTLAKMKGAAHTPLRSRNVTLSQEECGILLEAVRPSLSYKQVYRLLGRQLWSHQRPLAIPLEMKLRLIQRLASDAKRHWESHSACCQLLIEDGRTRVSQVHKLPLTEEEKGILVDGIVEHGYDAGWSCSILFPTWSDNEVTLSKEQALRLMPLALKHVYTILSNRFRSQDDIKTGEAMLTQYGDSLSELEKRRLNKLVKDVKAA